MPRWKVSLFVLLLIAVPLVAQQEERVTPVTATYSWTSDAGDTVGGGVDGMVSSATGVFRFKRALLGGVELIYEQLTIDQKTIEMCPPRDPAQLLTPTTDYLGAVRCPPSVGMDSIPSLDVTHNSGCNMLTGEFSVGEMLYDYYGWPLRFSGTFEQHCEGNPPALNGVVDAEMGTVGATTIAKENLLVAMVNRLFEVTRMGDYVETIPVLVETDTNPTGLHDSKEDVRDIYIDNRMRVFIFNGTGTRTNPIDEVRLTVYDSRRGTWDHYPGPPGWATFEANQSSPAFGALAPFQNYIFASDTSRTGTPEKGIIRFDMANSFAAERFADTENYIDLHLGLDGKLYGLQLDFKEVDVFDPSTPNLDPIGGTITLDTGGASTRIVSIVADASGNIFGMETFGDLHQFDPTTGLSTKELDVSPSFEVTDLDFDTDGGFVAASQAQKILFADAALTSFSTFDLPDPSPSNIDMPGLDAVHVAVIPHQPIFDDGFESGDTSAWSGLMP